MSNNTRRLAKWLPVIGVMGSIVLGTTASAPAKTAKEDCTTHELVIPDVGDRHLKNGDYDVAFTDLAHGKLVARVHVKGNVASEPVFFFNGKALKQDNTIRQDARECFEKAKKRVAQRHVRKRKRRFVIVLAFCDESVRTCVAMVCTADMSACGSATTTY